ncbi:MAG: nodulation protein NfeD [Candidatus Bipolaricaulia bacterium]
MSIARIRGRTIALLAIGALFLLLAGGSAQPTDGPSSADGRIVVLKLDSSVNPITKDYLVGSIEEAERSGARLVLIELNTPGGLVTSTREIVGTILNADVPVAVWVGPSGAWAASAGTFITMSANIAAMAPGTSIGAAYPVNLGGGSSLQAPGPLTPSNQGGQGGQGDQGNQGSQDGQDSSSSDKGPSASKKKTVNFTAEWARQIAEARGRNADWAEKAVRESVTAGAQEAVDKNIIDLVATSREDLLAKLDGYKLSNGRTLETSNAPVDVQSMTWREDLLNYLANPTLVYLLLTIAPLALIYEFLNPTIGIGFIVGGIFLLLAFMGLQILPVNVAGVALILFGLLAMVLDVFSANNGILTTGGVVSLLIGSFSLFDISAPNIGLSPWTILPTVGAIAVSFGFFITKGLMVQRHAPVTGREGMIGAHGVAKDRLNPEGWVLVHGEHWTGRVVDDGPVREGESVVVERMEEGAKLAVRRRSADPSADT